MQINQSVLDKVKATNAQLLVVTKYWNASKTNTIRDWLKDEPCVLEVFIQVNVGEDPSKEGIAPSDLADFLESLKSLENINVIGLSTMGWGDFTENKKRQEFKSLIDLKNSYLPSGLTSAGTSRDYHLALQEGIDIVRVGTAIVV